MHLTFTLAKFQIDACKVFALRAAKMRVVSEQIQLLIVDQDMPQRLRLQFDYLLSLWLTHLRAFCEKSNFIKR